MKTIRQIADEIGVSKTAVNKQIANLGLRSGLRKNGNQFAIDEHQEALIKQAFSEKSQTEIENQTQTKSQTENHEVSDLVCVLQATIDTLQGQLEVKDRQIEQQAQTITGLLMRWLPPSRQRQWLRLSMRGRSSSSFLARRLGRISRVRSRRGSEAGLISGFEDLLFSDSEVN